MTAVDPVRASARHDHVTMIGNQELASTGEKRLRQDLGKSPFMVTIYLGSPRLLQIETGHVSGHA
jgi:hypothetical protein